MQLRFFCGNLPAFPARAADERRRISVFRRDQARRRSQKRGGEASPVDMCRTDPPYGNAAVLLLRFSGRTAGRRTQRRRLRESPPCAVCRRGRKTRKLPSRFRGAGALHHRITSGPAYSKLRRWRGTPARRPRRTRPASPACTTASASRRAEKRASAAGSSGRSQTRRGPPPPAAAQKRPPAAGN